MVARLGYGALTAKGLSGDGAGGPEEGKNRTWFVAGGFVQVSPSKPGDAATGGTVSVLTNRAVPPGEIDAAAARAELSEINSRVPSTPEAVEQKSRDQARARAMIASAA